MGKFHNLYFSTHNGRRLTAIRTFVLLNFMAFIRLLKPQHPEDTGKVKMF